MIWHVMQHPLLRASQWLLLLLLLSWPGTALLLARVCSLGLCMSSASAD